MSVLKLKEIAANFEHASRSSDPFRERFLVQFLHTVAAAIEGATLTPVKVPDIAPEAPIDPASFFAPPEPPIVQPSEDVAPTDDFEIASPNEIIENPVPTAILSSSQDTGTETGTNTDPESATVTLDQQS